MQENTIGLDCTLPTDVLREKKKERKGYGWLVPTEEKDLWEDVKVGTESGRRTMMSPISGRLREV